MKNKKQIRENFRNAVFKRDSQKCRVCGETSKLDAHHITDRNDMPFGGYVKENGITLCDKEDGCHMKAELFHITNGEKYHEGFHPNDLYKKINSSYELAFQKSNQNYVN